MTTLTDVANTFFATSSQPVNQGATFMQIVAGAHQEIESRYMRSSSSSVTSTQLFR